MAGCHWVEMNSLYKFCFNWAIDIPTVIYLMTLYVSCMYSVEWWVMSCEGSGRARCWRNLLQYYEVTGENKEKYESRFYGYVSVHRKSILWGSNEMQLFAVNFYFTAGSLYMFRVLSTPIIRSTLTFRHRASCILGQAFRYSPENAFYIFNQHIYFIIWYLLDRASLI